MSKKPNPAGHALKAYVGGANASPEDKERAQRFLEKTGSVSFGGASVYLGSPRRTKTKYAPAKAYPGAGLAWIKEFQGYEGDDCLLFPFRTAANPRGHVLFNFRKMPAAKAMCFLVHKSPPDGKTFALHTCGNGHLGCVNPRHVYWGDESDNARDAARHRTEGKPEARRRKGEPSPRIAATSGNPPGISSPRHGEAWSAS